MMRQGILIKDQLKRKAINGSKSMYGAWVGFSIVCLGDVDDNHNIENYLHIESNRGNGVL